MIQLVPALLRRPDLWPTAIRQARRTAAHGWWRRPPFLPVPSGRYLEFRLLTQYGDASAKPAPRDVITYLEWCKTWSHV